MHKAVNHKITPPALALFPQVAILFGLSPGIQKKTLHIPARSKSYYPTSLPEHCTILLARERDPHTSVGKKGLFPFFPFVSKQNQHLKYLLHFILQSPFPLMF